MNVSAHENILKKRALALTLSSAIAALFAIAPNAARAQDPICQAPARIEAAAGPNPAPRERVENYRPVLQECRNALNETRLAIRAMRVDGVNLLLMVDPATLATSLEHQRCWTCAETGDEAQKDTRFFRAIRGPADDGAPPRSAVLRNAGISHGMGAGSFITGDLCPSRRPLDRGFLEMLESLRPRMPVALSISGLWLIRHGADFQWLRQQARAQALAITWVNHSYHHPFFRGRPPARNFLLTPGFDAQAEILDTERVLIANGETPSVFFRFPGLISDAALMEAVRRDHLVALGADAWLALSPPLRPGAIVLVHPNGNEPAGLRLFSKWLDQGRLPRPFRPIIEAPP